MKFRKHVCLLIGGLLIAGPAMADTSTVNTTSNSTVNSTTNNTNTNNNTNNNTTNYTGTNTNSNTNNNTNTTTYTGSNTNVNTNSNTNVNTTNYTGTSTNTNNNNNNTTYTGTSTNTNINTNNNTINSTSTNTNTNNSTDNQTVNQTNTNNTSNVTSNTNNNNTSNITNNTTTSNNNNTNNNVNTSTSTSDSNVTSNNKNENINVNHSDQKIKQEIKSPPPSAIAPAIGGSYSQDLCTTGVGGAVQTQVFGISAGKTVRDENCERIKLSRGLYDMGMKVAAVSLMCQDARVFNAMLMAGTPCPYRGKIGDEALNAWKMHPAVAPKDSLIEEQEVAGWYRDKQGRKVEYNVYKKDDFCQLNPDEEVCSIDE